LYANTSKITNKNTVEITWENPSPGLFDMIAIYTPPSREIKVKRLCNEKLIHVVFNFIKFQAMFFELNQFLFREGSDSLPLN
jgi:hypothetical protein